MIPKVVSVRAGHAYELRNRTTSLVPSSFAHIDNGDHRTTALRPLVHRVDGDEHGGIADRRGGDTTDRAFRMAMMMHVGIIQHDLATAAQRTAAVGLALHEAVDHPPAQILGARARGQFKAGIAD